MPSSPDRRSRRSRPPVRTALLPLVLALTGCSAAPVAAAGDGPTPTATPTPTPTPTCTPSTVTLTAPADGAAVSPGPLTAQGAALPGETLLWTLQDASGAAVATGTAAAAADGGWWSVPLQVTSGAAGLVVRPLDDPAACATDTAFTVLRSGPTWTAGASGTGVADGSFAAWRGSPVPLAGTWADSDAGQLALWPLRPDGEYAAWTGDLEIAVGAIDRGETWTAAARGAYDERWARSLQRLAALWEGRPGTVFIRFAHEFNGTWYPWSVTAATAPDFVTAWQRFRALQRQWFPAAQLVFSPNSETPAGTGLDWRQAFPGRDAVDVVSVSYFNAYPWVGTVPDFDALALARDSYGAPRGIRQLQEFARSVGLPFAVSEWGNNAQFGDGAVYTEQMYGLFNATAGTGPGQLRYEVLFNTPRDAGTFSVMPTTRAPTAAETYRRLW